MSMQVDHGKLLEIRSEILARNAELAGAGKPAAGQKFDGIMTQAVKEVAGLQENASQATAAFERGDSNDIAGMMIARQKSSLAFQAALQVRNKVLSAYKDVMNMPV